MISNTGFIQMNHNFYTFFSVSNHIGNKEG